MMWPFLLEIEPLMKMYAVVVPLFYSFFSRPRWQNRSVFNLIRQNLGGQDFRRTKIFGGQNFRNQVEISAVLTDEIFLSVSYFPIQFTRFVLI